MAGETAFDYYHGDESSQFSFYRIPRELVTGDCFKRLSTDAKLHLSIHHSWRLRPGGNRWMGAIAGKKSKRTSNMKRPVST